MRRAVPTLACVAGLVLQSIGADAETWTVLRGKLTKDGVARPLSGSFTGFMSAGDSEDEPDFLGVEDFSLTAGRLVDSVTFRFLELRADASDGGVAQGTVPDSDAPVRLLLKGDVYEVEQTFLAPGFSCAPPVATPIPGSGGGAAGGSVTIISSGSFGRRTFVWTGSSGAGSALVMHSAAQPLTAALLPYNSSLAVSPMSVAPLPTLEQLGIRAPEGAEIVLDSNGALTVTSTGDLFVEGTLPEAPIPGLTSVTLYTRARIMVTGRIVLPGVSLRLDGGEVHAGGDGDPNGWSGQPACSGLTPILPTAERLVGQFSLVASAARQIQIDVMPGDKRNRVFQNVLRAPIGVAILGSRTLDVADVDLDTLRLGAGEAKPNRPDLSLPSFPQSPSFPATPLVMPVNRDRFSDLLAFYPLPDAEIAYGDTELCLVAQTHDGELLEGCDRIDTLSGFPAVR